MFRGGVCSIPMTLGGHPHPRLAPPKHPATGRAPMCSPNLLVPSVGQRCVALITQFVEAFASRSNMTPFTREGILSSPQVRSAYEWHVCRQWSPSVCSVCSVFTRAISVFVKLPKPMRDISGHDTWS